MADLKTDYKDQLLDTSVNTERKFNLVDQDGNVIASGVSIRDITQYSQAGDTFGAADINETNKKINAVNNNLKDKISSNDTSLWIDSTKDTSVERHRVHANILSNANPTLRYAHYLAGETNAYDEVLLRFDGENFWGIGRKAGADTVTKKLGSVINIPMFEVISTADLYGTSNLKFDVSDCDTLTIGNLETLKGTGYITITGDGTTLYSKNGNYLTLADITVDISAVSEINIYIRSIGASGQIATLSIYDMSIQ